MHHEILIIQHQSFQIAFSANIHENVPALILKSKVE